MTATIETTPPETRVAAEPDFTTEQMSAYYLELERLLERIESSVTHYQALGIERSAVYEEIRLTYHQALGLLYPAYKLSATFPADTLARIERAFGKVSRAYSVLANYANRLSYDNALQGRSPDPKPTTTAPSVKHISDQGSPADAVSAMMNSPARPAAARASEQPISIHNRPSVQKVHSTFSESASNDNRRRCERFRLSIPARITGFEKKAGKWNEMAETIDVSRTGVNLRMRRRVRHGTVLYMTLPLPSKLRGHGYAEPSYNVYALVRRVEPATKRLASGRA